MKWLERAPHVMRRSLLGGVLLALAASVAAQAVHDYENLPEARLLQTPKSVLGHLPKRIDGSPDWVLALEKGLIAPRSTRQGTLRPPEPLEMPREGIVFTNTLFMPYVVFPHQQHAEWLSCMNCHESWFEMRATGRGQGMTAIFQGRHCGYCHGRVAFSPEGSCYRCHSKPNPNAIKENSPFVEPVEVEKPVVEEAAKKPRRGQRGETKRTPGGRLVPSRVVAPVDNGSPPPPDVPVLK